MLNRERDRLLGGESGRRSGEAKPEGGGGKQFNHGFFLSGVQQERRKQVEGNRAGDEDRRQDEARLDDMVWKGRAQAPSAQAILLRR